MNQSHILLIDDDVTFRTSVQFALEDLGYNVQTASDVLSGVNLFAKHLDTNKPFDLILTDMWMPLQNGQPENEEGGLAVIEEVAKRSDRVIVIVMTAYGTIQNAVQAVQLGAFDYLEKPFETEELRLRVEKALRHHALQSENQSLKRENQSLFERVATPYQSLGIIGSSESMQSLLYQIQRAAQTDATVLIQGESGTGKELVAHAIHYNSPRARKAMIPLNCAAFPEHLIESELFGHIRGAFTGANTNRIGAFEEAEHGTIFLDEIGEMPLAMQPRLLRVLEGKKIKRVGENRERDVDTRVIAATNRDLHEHIQASTFREDLYERLNVIPIQIPPLRQHKEDIPELVNHFLGQFDPVGRIKEISQDALDVLMVCDWPRNVRELRNVIERTLLFMTDEVIKAHHLHLPGQPPRLLQKANQDSSTFSITLSEDCFTIDKVEEEIIRQAYAYTDGNIAHAARLIGMARSTFRRKLNRLK